SLPPTSPPTPHDCSSLPPSPKPRARHREAEIPRSAAMPAPAALALAAALLLAAASICAEAVWLDMPQTGTKCVSEEIQANVVVLADYALMYESHPSSHPTLAVKVTSPYGYTLHENGNVTVGQFAFTTSEAGNFLACFWIDSAEKGSGVSVNLDWKTGIATKDWDAIAKKEKIEVGL
uniref:GOLD domain-containing protein n=2 Tax=Aegilops tauschii subsp. strangulata TaxID=200361 RepID=A0A453PQB6_AEGTS